MGRCIWTWGCKRRSQRSCSSPNQIPITLWWGQTTMERYPTLWTTRNWKIIPCQSMCHRMWGNFLLYQFLWSCVKVDGRVWETYQIAIQDGKRQETIHYLYWWGWLSLWIKKWGRKRLIKKNQDWVPCSDARSGKQYGWCIGVRSHKCTMGAW